MTTFIKTKKKVASFTNYVEALLEHLA